jgi:NADPH-dependent curcumin reductase CurA
MTTASHEVRLHRYPSGAVGPSDFYIAETTLPPPEPGQVLVRNDWTSVDPGMRLRLRSDAPAGYFAAFPLDAPMDGIFTLGTVVESRADGFAEGDLVWHAQGWREFSLVRAGEEALGGLATLRRLDGSVDHPEWYLGPLGAMGLTAYSGLAVSQALTEPGVMWVSAGAGAVGSLVAQIGRLTGSQVVASAGGEDKVAWLRERARVSAFNYRDGDLDAKLSAAAPAGLDIYFDNVGGDHFEAALRHLNRRGRVTLCGSISDYEREPVGPRNLFLVTSKELTLRGVRGSAHLDLLDEMQHRVRTWLAAGELVYEQTVFDGLDQAPKALEQMLAGATLGKTLVRVTRSDESTHPAETPQDEVRA